MDSIDVAVRVGEALDRAGIAYFVGGSLASSLQGEPRATNDIDIVVQAGVPDLGRLAHTSEVRRSPAQRPVHNPRMVSSIR